MKKLGTSRRLDELGRVVVPKELRERCGIETGDQIEFFTEGDAIVMRKYRGCCVFCKGTDNVKVIMERAVCAACLQKIKDEQ